VSWRDQSGRLSRYQVRFDYSMPAVPDVDGSERTDFKVGISSDETFSIFADESSFYERMTPKHDRHDLVH
jgi:hypothetical protein